MSNPMQTRIRYLYEETLACVKCAYVTTPPNDRYAHSVTMLMLGTIAQESRFYYRRQGGFSWDSPRGAWGLGQMEQAGIGRSLNVLRKNQQLADRMGKWLFGQDDDDMEIIQRMVSELSVQDLCRMVSSHDRLALAFMRLYYIACPGAVPDTLQQQAAYYKQFWNTYAGKATTGQYIDNFQRLVEPALKDYANGLE